MIQYGTINDTFSRIVKDKRRKSTGKSVKTLVSLKEEVDKING